MLLKFGAAHLLRGLNPSQQFDLGTLLPDLALQDGAEWLSVYAIGGAGAHYAQFDPRTLRSVELSSADTQEEWTRPFLQAAAPEGWTVFDLKALRPAAGRLGTLPTGVREILYGVDLVVVLTGSEPQHDLLPALPEGAAGHAPTH